MLYDRWREVASARGAELALKDLSDGRAWTFAQMLAASDVAKDADEGWVCPKGKGPEFVFEVLRAWRFGRVVCPLEESESAPIGAALEKSIAHVKRTSATTGAARFVIFRGEQLAADCTNIVAT